MLDKGKKGWYGISMKACKVKKIIRSNERHPPGHGFKIYNQSNKVRIKEGYYLEIKKDGLVYPTEKLDPKVIVGVATKVLHDNMVAVSGIEHYITISSDNGLTYNTGALLGDDGTVYVDENIKENIQFFI